MNDTIKLNGRTYRIDIVQDTCMGAPWEENDGHGIVSDWTARDKRAGEWVLNLDQRYGSNGKRRFYDYAATIKHAHADGWGLNDTSRATLAARLKREPTAREVIAEAVRLDYEHLRAWCNDEWGWCGVCVTDITDDEHAPIDYAYALWGMQSDDDEGLTMEAQSLAEQAAHDYVAANRFTLAMACGV